MEDYSELEDFEIEEAIELLGKVSPGDWPDIEDIAGVSVEELLKVYDEDASNFEFVEDNLSTGHRVESTLSKVISSVFGDKVSKIRNQKGHEPNHVNNFLQEEDGTFAGTFDYNGSQFLFEVFPDEKGWVVTYRMSPKSVDNLPARPVGSSRDGNKSRHVRYRGWK